MPDLPFRLLCKKIGMTRFFREDGMILPSTILDVSINFPIQTTQLQNDLRLMGALQDSKNKIRIRKPQLCFNLKTNSLPTKKVWAFPTNSPPSQKGGLEEEAFGCNEAKKNVQLRLGQKIKIRGKSIGKGFAGTIKRHNFKSGRASHGNSKAHNKPGSTGMTQDPGRVFPGKLMPGHLGSKNVSIRNCQIVFLDEKKGLVAIKGPTPGYKGAFLLLSDIR
ncbi:50S ribosomal subunit protein L3 [Candidatus Tremblaya phenacola PAVE]|nr:50S ribosomal subunit protein L3 [Candidatus Tremblaya phenacola PAVE]